jgi:outer membrane translocation and assembly module TamA
MGVQYLLPVGPARLDFALNPDREQDRDEREYVVHFSIGMAF